MKLLECPLYIEDIKKIVRKKDFLFLQNKTILITGGLGLIGSSIVDLIIVLNKYFGLDCNIIIGDISPDRFSSMYKGEDNVSFLNWDVIQPFNYEKQIDFIIHAAGIASPELYMTKPVETMLSNISGAQSLLKFACSHDVKSMVYISSSEIYGQNNKTASEENDYGIISIDNVRNCYSVAKKSTEMLCKCYSYENNVNCVIARPGHIFGPNASYNDKRVSSAFCYDAINGNDLILKSDGSQLRSYCYSLDCAAAILFLLQNGVSGESYNIGSKERISIKTLATLIAKHANVKVKYRIPSSSEYKSFNIMRDSSLNSTKLLKLGFDYSFTFEEGIKHTLLIMRDTKK